MGPLSSPDSQVFPLAQRVLLVLGSLLVPAKNLIDRSVGERGDKQVAVGAGPNVRGDSEAFSKQQAFALRDVPFIVIVGNSTFSMDYKYSEINGKPIS